MNTITAQSDVYAVVAQVAHELVSDTSLQVGNDWVLWVSRPRISSGEP